ncbi:hypothetical protein Micbo1qcDRAFT_178967 [Microdochium bolleyi]|uniref:Uncharacterized protein n=1 Tax=Microdochium bolleyi TaxID=196109 RepID=A0A136IRA3_9PEZI|nr:hypothetical protein Micbo1qcDRAFT_178967 [Microdochium bolleyi]
MCITYLTRTICPRCRREQPPLTQEPEWCEDANAQGYWKACGREWRATRILVAQGPCHACQVASGGSGSSDGSYRRTWNGPVSGWHYNQQGAITSGRVITL